MDLGLKGLRAIVTGGSKGIGRRCADILADEGAHVAICARNAAEVQATVAALKAKGAAILSWTIKSAKDEAKARRVADNVTFEGYLARHPA